MKSHLTVCYITFSKNESIKQIWATDTFTFNDGTLFTCGQICIEFCLL